MSHHRHLCWLEVARRRNDVTSLTAPPGYSFSNRGEVVAALVTEQKVLRHIDIRTQNNLLHVIRPSYLAVTVVVTVEVKCLEVDIFPTESVNTAEVSWAILVALTMFHLLLLDTDPFQHIPPGVMTIALSISSVATLAL